MRCLACGQTMQVTQSEQHESIETLAYYSLTCHRCGDTDRRLLTKRGTLPEDNLDAKQTPRYPSLPRPRDMFVRTDNVQRRRTLMKLLQEISDFQSRRSDMAALLKDPKQFIETFVRRGTSKRPLPR